MHHLECSIYVSITPNLREIPPHGASPEWPLTKANRRRNWGMSPTYQDQSLTMVSPTIHIEMSLGETPFAVGRVWVSWILITRPALCS
ncbi:hypothetical protein CEP54_002823 [Fusarium duplospermum]|uniref:Uncharacterized protein n=1 Tax=Fusarium duplospermum TaxID=1325734 RepID=A0A428QSZ7_9HYPO|nr:hypothetical protein CEP54_002823 [Fusarium duplospermum]